MRKILLTVALLSTVTSEGLETKKHHPLLLEDGPQFWLARGSRIPGDLTHLEFDQSLKDKNERRHQESESSLSRISGSQLHNFNRFLINNPNLSTSQEDRQNFNQQSSIDKKKLSFLMPFDRFELPKINLNQLDCSWERCQRTQGWRLQEPLYVDEPRWVQVNSDNFETPLSRNEPFFVNRGKRSPQLKTLNPLKSTIDDFVSDSTLDIEYEKSNTLTNLKEMDDEKTHQKGINQGLDKLKSRIKKKDTTKESDESKETLQETGRIKREDSQKTYPELMKIIQKRSEFESQKLLENIERSLIGRDHTGGMTKASSYLQPRNKHSDILEILEEPFFISRGKKNNLFHLRDFLMEDVYVDQYLKHLIADLEEDEIFSEIELGAKERILEKILNNEVRRNNVQKKNKNEPGSNPKRGILEELNLQVDPFYVARG